MAETKPQLEPALLEIVSDDFPIFHAHDVRQFIENVLETHEHAGDFKEAS